MARTSTPVPLCQTQKRTWSTSVIFSHDLWTSNNEEESAEGIQSRHCGSIESQWGSSSSAPMSEGGWRPRCLFQPKCKLEGRDLYRKWMEYADPQRIYLMWGVAATRLADGRTHQHASFCSTLPFHCRTILEEAPETRRSTWRPLTYWHENRQVRFTSRTSTTWILTRTQSLRCRCIFITAKTTISCHSRPPKAMKRRNANAIEDTGHALTPEQQGQIGFEIAWDL